MTANQSKLEQFLNALEGGLIIILDVIATPMTWAFRVDFLRIVEKNP